ncbi:MAG TPA: hypothetical protein VEX35_06365 [Allosphingosinicella sp.]|nr:hypothetical protein [Allosphingosinicella sp.]
MGFLELVASLLLATTQSPAEDPAHWRCIHDVDRAQGRVMVTRSLDAEGRFLYDYVGWLPRRRFGASAVGWERLDPGSTALPWTLRTDSVATMFPLARPARRPVWLVLRVDGRIAGRRLLFRQLSDLPDYERGQPEFSVGFSGHITEAGRGPDVVPELMDATEAVLSAEEEGGETLAREPITLPGRALIEEAVAEAAPAIAAAAADYRRLCREEGQPPQMQPIPSPIPLPATH